MFSAKFRYLQNEAFLAQGSLSVGLTELRNAAHPDKATFYSGFFNVATALERLMKLAIITDHMIQNAYSVPSKADLKRHGHDLLSLYSSCALIAERLALKDISKPVNGSIEEQLLMFFSDFATHARYHNLDALSAGQATYEDPLARWEGILIKVLEKDAPSKKLDLLKAQAHALSEAIADATSAIQHGMDGRLLTLEEILAAPQMHQIAAQYTMVRVFKVLTPLLDLLGHLGHEGFYGSPHSDGPYVPLYQEFFVWYSGTAAEIRRKKRWP